MRMTWHLELLTVTEIGKGGRVEGLLPLLSYGEVYHQLQVQSP